MTADEIRDRVQQCATPAVAAFFQSSCEQGKGVEEALLMTLENVCGALETAQELLQRSISTNHNHPVYDVLEQEIEDFLAGRKQAE